MTTPNITCSENNPNVLKTQPIRDEKKISEENWANQKWTKVGYAIFFQKVDKKCHEKIEWIFVTKAWFWPNYKTNLNENLVMLQSRVVLKTDIFSTACKHYFCGPLASRIGPLLSLPKNILWSNSEQLLPLHSGTLF